MRAVAVILICATAWVVGWTTQRSAPAGFDFIAIYASARLVATGQWGSVTDPDAILAMEHATLPERTILLRNPNPPALSLVLAPLGALPFELAFAVMLTLGVAALAASAFLLASLARANQHARLLPFALLAPPSLIALAEGQTTPFVLLAIAGSLRAPPRLSGALLGLVAFRPQLIALFAVIALADARRRLPFLAVVFAVAAVSTLMVGLDGLARYPQLLGPAAAELGPGELGIPALLRRAGIGAADPALANLALSAIGSVIAAIAVLLAAPGRRTVVAAPATLLSAPHALLHDAVFAYPAIAERATSTRATFAWVLSGLVVVLLHEAGVPLAPLWLLGLLLWRRDVAAGQAR